MNNVIGIESIDEYSLHLFPFSDFFVPLNCHRVIVVIFIRSGIQQNGFLAYIILCLKKCVNTRKTKTLALVVEKSMQRENKVVSLMLSLFPSHSFEVNCIYQILYIYEKNSSKYTRFMLHTQETLQENEKYRRARERRAQCTAHVMSTIIEWCVVTAVQCTNVYTFFSSFSVDGTREKNVYI